MAQEEGKYFVVINSKEGKRYDWISEGNKLFIFSPDDNQKIAYIVWGGGWEEEKYFIVVNGGKGEKYDYDYHYYTAGIPVFSPDSQKVTYKAEEEGKEFIVANGKEGKRYDKIENPIFSPDGKYLAYGARDGNELWWVVEEL